MQRPYHRLTVLALAASVSAGAQAIEIDTGNPDLTLHWDNTVKFSLMDRLKSRSPKLATSLPGGTVNTNQDDGDNNFNPGIVSRRLDLFSEADLSYQRSWGARVSGAAWYDFAYDNGTANPSPATANHTPASQFSHDTRSIMGRSGELLDAFAYGKFDVGQTPVTVRAGRYSLLWGESLFFGANGIAGGQAPVDVIKLSSVPNSQFKETVRPTGKVSAQAQLTSDISLGGYVGYEWEPSRLIPTGSYLSVSDFVGPGGEEVITAPHVPPYLRGNDIKPVQGGQGGVQLKMRAFDADFGIYAIRFSATAPSNIYLVGNPAPSTFEYAYQRGIRAFGLSAARAFDNWSLATEASYRSNSPMSSSSQHVTAAQGFDNLHNQAYAIGDSLHLQFSWLASLGPSFISREASFVGELAFNERIKYTHGQQYANPNADRSAAALRTIYTPTYRQVVPGLDLSPSIGASYGKGRSSAVGPAFAVNHGGDASLGLSGVYLDRWNVALNYVHYYGPVGSNVDNQQNIQFMQSLADRDFVTLSLRTTF